MNPPIVLSHPSSSSQIHDYLQIKFTIHYSRVVKTMVPWYPWYLGRFQNFRKIEKIHFLRQKNMMENKHFNSWSSVLDCNVVLNMFHIYFIGFVWSSLSISPWIPCRKVNNKKLGVRKKRMFLRPCMFVAREIKQKLRLI